MPDETAIGKDLDAFMDDVTGTEMYFRTPNGEVHIGRIGLDESEKIKRIREGWKPLDEYGSFKIQPYHTDHPFEVLFQRGGAKELSVKEIIDQGFYFRPPLVPRCTATVGESHKSTDGQRGHLGGNSKTTKHTPRCWTGAKPAEFPQLAERTIEGPFECKRCFNDTGEPKLFALERGLRQHEGVIHPDEVGNDRLGAQLIQGLSGGGSQSGMSSSEADLRGELLKMREQVETLMGAPRTVSTEFTPAATPYVCGLCGEAQPNAFKLNSHIKAHQTEAVPA